jgi:hypothetical protein
MVYVGVVTRTSPTNGTIVYRIQNGYELDELHDVAPTPYVNNGVLYRDTSANLWKSATIDTLLGGTPLLTVPTLDQVTTAGNTTTNAITVGGLTVNTNLIYTDLVNNAVIIGATSLTNALNKFEVRDTGTTGVIGRLQFRNDNNSYTYLSITSDNVGFLLGAHSSGSGYISANQSLNFTSNQSTNGASVWLGNTARFRVSNAAETLRYLTVSTAGNLLVGTATDAGYMLDVNGTVRVVGAAYFQNEINGLWGVGELTFNRGVNSNTPTLGVGNTNASGKFAALLAGTAGAAFVYDSAGYFGIGPDTKANYTNRTLGGSGVSHLRVWGSTGNVAINSTTDAGYKLDVNGTARVGGAFYQTTASTTGTLMMSLLSGSFTIEKYEENGNNLGSILIKAKNNSSLVNSIVIDYAGLRVFNTIKADTEMVIGTGSGGALRWSSNSAVYGWRINVGTNFGIQSAYSNSSPTWSEYLTVIHQTQTGAGNVGIGTTNPTSKLDVVGDINTSGVFKVGGVSGWTGTINIPLNPPGQQSIQVTGGIIINVF